MLCLEYKFLGKCMFPEKQKFLKHREDVLLILLSHIWAYNRFSINTKSVWMNLKSSSPPSTPLFMSSAHNPELLSTGENYFQGFWRKQCLILHVRNISPHFSLKTLATPVEFLLLTIIWLQPPTSGAPLTTFCTNLCLTKPAAPSPRLLIYFCTLSPLLVLPQASPKSILSLFFSANSPSKNCMKRKKKNLNQIRKKGSYWNWNVYFPRDPRQVTSLISC